jgi:ABC-type glycerol-3-phosphate transport system permease component
MSADDRERVKVSRRFEYKKTGVSTPGIIIVYLFLLLVCLTMLFPFIHELAKSFSYPTEVDAGRVSVWPREFTFGNYHFFFRYDLLREPLIRSFFNSIYITVVGTVWSVFFTAMMAFPLSRPRKEFRIGPIIMGVVIFSFVFRAPLVPYFLAIRAYGLMDSHWAIIIPHTIIPFHLILMLTFYRGLPEELFDSCRIDGGGDFRLFWQIALPLSKAALATIGIFTAVMLWNIFLHAVLFIRTAELNPLQVYVRGVMIAEVTVLAQDFAQHDPFAISQSIKSSLILMTTVPIIVVYPFLQKYFIKGALLGALKA